MSNRTSGARGPYSGRWRSKEKPEAPLRLARLEQHHTQAQAAEAIGLGRSAIARIEGGTLRPPHMYFAGGEIVERYQAYLRAGGQGEPKKRASRRG